MQKIKNNKKTRSGLKNDFSLPLNPAKSTGRHAYGRQAKNAKSLEMTGYYIRADIFEIASKYVLVLNLVSAQ